LLKHSNEKLTGCNETGQISAKAVGIYEKVYLPALFEEWSPRAIEAGQIQSGQRVLEVAISHCSVMVLILLGTG
jgi:hypothetical protein